MTTKTTTTLRLPLLDRVRLAWSIYERTARDGLLGAAFVVFLLIIHSLLGPAEAAPALEPIAQRQPIIMIATAQPQPTPPPAPTATPWPTAEPVIIVQQVEVPAPPETVYVPQPVYVQVQAAPTLEPQPYNIASAPQVDYQEKPADDRAAHYAEATSGHGTKALP